MDTLAFLLTGDFAYAFAWTMIHSLWQCGIIALGLWFSLFINRHQSANSRYLQGILAMALCVAASVATFTHLYDGIQAAHASLSDDLVLRYSGGIWEQTYSILNKNLHYIIFVWCVGFSVQLMRYAYDFSQALQLRNRDCDLVEQRWAQRCAELASNLGVARTVIVKNSARVSSICVIGHLRPVILLPIGLLTQLPCDQVEALLLHELAHIRRNDYLVNTIQGFVRLLYFFNPAVLWISQRIDIERENACDDIAVANCGSAKTYAQGLANISVLELRLSSVLAARGRAYRMLPRVTRLFNHGSGVTRSAEQLASGLCALGLIFAMNVSAGEFRLIPEEPHNTTTEPQITTPVEPVTTLALSESPSEAPENPPVNAAPVKDVAAPKVPSKMQLASNAPVTKPQQVPHLEKVAAKPVAPASAVPPKPVTAALDYQAAHASPPLQVAQASTAKPRRNSVEDVQLTPMKTPEFNQFMLAEKFTLPVSRKIYLEKITVSFADIWMKRFAAETSNAYRDYIASEYSQEFRETLSEALASNGWQVVDRPDEDTLKLKASLIDLYIFEPETAGVKQTIIAQAGQSGVELIYSSPQGQAFMKIVDHRTTGDTSGGPVIANRATNLHYFKRLMASWAKASAPYLEEVMKIVESQK